MKLASETFLRLKEHLELIKTIRLLIVEIRIILLGINLVIIPSHNKAQVLDLQVDIQSHIHLLKWKMQR